MSAISLSSFNFRSTQGATLPSAQQAQRGTTFSPSVARSGNAGSASSAYCPTCAGGVSGGNAARSASSSFCPTCNTAGGRQTSITGVSNSAPLRSGAAQSGSPNSFNHTAHQGGRICVGCAYQGR